MSGFLMFKTFSNSSFSIFISNSSCVKSFNIIFIELELIIGQYFSLILTRVTLFSLQSSSFFKSLFVSLCQFCPSYSIPIFLSGIKISNSLFFRKVGL